MDIVRLSTKTIQQQTNLTYLTFRKIRGLMSIFVQLVIILFKIIHIFKYYIVILEGLAVYCRIAEYQQQGFIITMPNVEN